MGRDSRAVEQELLSLVDIGGKFHALVEFVNKHEELELCFRGNSSANGMICIYYNNFIAYRISGTNDNSEITVSVDQGRYSEDWQAQYQKIGLDISPKEYKKENPNFKTKEKKPYIYSYHIQEGSYLKIEDKSDKYDLFFWENTWSVIKKLLDDYLDENVEIDRYREHCGAEQTGRKKDPKIEKKAQQKLFSYYSDMKKKYYFYDLEYIQKGDNTKNKNKPDALAIEYVNGVANSLVFVEVKSKKDSIGVEGDNAGNKKEDSTLAGHLKGMRDYIVEAKETGLIDNRIHEAAEILRQYKKLGVRKVDHLLTDEEISKLKKNQKILVYFTDEADKAYSSDNTVKEEVDNQIKRINEDVSTDIVVDFMLKSELDYEN